MELLTKNFRTGLRELDLFSGDFQRPCVIAIASRPQEGKTSLAMTMAENGATHYNSHVAFFSGKYSRTELDKMRLCAQKQIAQSTLYIEEIHDPDFETLVQKIDCHKGPLDAIVLDDIPVDKKIYCRLHDIAYGMNVPVFFTCSSIQSWMKIVWKIHRDYLDSHRDEDKYHATITLRNRRIKAEKPFCFIPEYLSFYDHPGSVGMDNF